MNQEDLKRIIERNSTIETVSTETGIEAGLTIAKVAGEQNISWALAGGIAMHI